MRLFALTKESWRVVFLFMLSGCAMIGLPTTDVLGHFKIAEGVGESVVKLGHNYHGISILVRNDLADSIANRRAYVKVENVGKVTISVMLLLEDDKRKAGPVVDLVPGNTLLVYDGPLRSSGIDFIAVRKTKGARLKVQVIMAEPLDTTIELRIGAARGDSI